MLAAGEFMAELGLPCSIPWELRFILSTAAVMPVAGKSSWEDWYPELLELA